MKRVRSICERVQAFDEQALLHPSMARAAQRRKESAGKIPGRDAVDSIVTNERFDVSPVQFRKPPQRAETRHEAVFAAAFEDERWQLRQAANRSLRNDELGAAVVRANQRSISSGVPKDSPL